MSSSHGRGRLTTDGVDGPIDLEPGDVAILNNRSWLQLEGGTGDAPRRELMPEADFLSTRIGADCGTDDVVVGGRVDLNSAGDALTCCAPTSTRPSYPRDGYGC